MATSSFIANYMPYQLLSKSRRVLWCVLRLGFASLLVLAATRTSARAGGEISVTTGKLEPEIAAAIGTGGTRRLLLRMTEQADLSGAALLTNKVDCLRVSRMSNRVGSNSARRIALGEPSGGSSPRDALNEVDRFALPVSGRRAVSHAG